jgi:hypothetical protein
MRKLEQVLAIADGDRRMHRPAARLREWRCGNVTVTVAVDAALSVVVQVSGPEAAVGDVAGLIAALSKAEYLAACAEQDTAAALIAQLSAGSAGALAAPRRRPAPGRSRPAGRPDLRAGHPAPSAGW